MKEEAWVLILVVAVVDLAVGLVKCTRLSAQSVRKSAMFLSSRAEIVRYIVRIVSQSGKIAAAKR
jgi:RNase P/RNase MRP subunit POP5